MSREGASAEEAPFSVDSGLDRSPLTVSHPPSRAILRPLDLAVIAAYFVFTLGLGLWVSRRQSSAGDYFLGARDLPAWAVMLSIVATETSALTVISVPGIGARGNLTFLQLTFGYFIGRVGVAAWLLPGLLPWRAGDRLPAARAALRPGGAAHHVGGVPRDALPRRRRAGLRRRRAAGARHRLEHPGRDHRDGQSQRSSTPGSAASRRWCGPTCSSSRCTWPAASPRLGRHRTGRRARARAGAGRGCGQAHGHQPGALPHHSYTLLGGIVGGALLSAASHGTDQLIVQRLLATRSLRDAQVALIGSGVVVMLQFALFLLVGSRSGRSGLAPDWHARRPDLLRVHRALAAGRDRRARDRRHPRGRHEHHSSSISALASAVTYDLYASITGRRDPVHLLRVGRFVSLVWGLGLIDRGARLSLAAAQGRHAGGGARAFHRVDHLRRAARHLHPRRPLAAGAHPRRDRSRRRHRDHHARRRVRLTARHAAGLGLARPGRPPRLAVVCAARHVAGRRHRHRCRVSCYAETPHAGESRS